MQMGGYGCRERGKDRPMLSDVDIYYENRLSKANNEYIVICNSVFCPMPPVYVILSEPSWTDI